jgi:hypothetical protein
VISVNYLAEVITEHFGGGTAHGFSTHNLHERKPRARPAPWLPCPQA